MMNVTNASILNSTYEAISELVKEFRDAPYMYLYESDIQSILFAKIKERVPNKITIIGSDSPCKEYDLSIVNTEYLSRIDIACIDVERVSAVEISKHKGCDIHIYKLPVHIGIEIKYRKMGDRFGITSCVSDLEKLNNLNITCPIVLGFIQNDSDIDNFIADIPDTYNLTEVSDINTESKAHIISPSTTWMLTHRIKGDGGIKK